MANARKILIVDDDTDLRDTLVEQLSLHDEFEASAVDTGAKGASAAKANAADLVLMDVGLPDTDGREVVRSLRKGGFKAPIIMLTGHDTDSDTILGLESGANDYVAKPFRFAVLLARRRAQLRQHEASEDAVFSVGPYSFRPGSKMLTGANARKVRLTEKETAILRFLYRAGHQDIAGDLAAADGEFIAQPARRGGIAFQHALKQAARHPDHRGMFERGRGGGPRHRHDQRELADQRARTGDHFGAGAVLDPECATLNHKSGVGIVARAEQEIAAGDIALLGTDRQHAQRRRPQQAQCRDPLEQGYVIFDRHAEPVAPLRIVR